MNKTNLSLAYEAPLATPILLETFSLICNSPTGEKYEEPEEYGGF